MNRMSIIISVVVLLLAFNINYAVTVPANIISYLPIILINYQSTAVAANTPIAIGATNAFASNVIGLNAAAYSQYETCNLNNAEFFFSNGTVATSWLEGNMLNEETANAMCSSAASQNTLAASSNILYWVLIPNSNFLPANTGSATTNTIYLGWAGNVISSSNTLFGAASGEAPQLSCNTPANTVTGCAAGQYGEYDTGWGIFSSYLNFNGISSSAPSGWTFTGSGGSISIYNGIAEFASSGNSAALYRNSQMYPIGNVIDGLIASNTPSSDELVGWSTATPSGTGSGWWGITGNGALSGSGGGSPAQLELVYVSSGTGTNVKGAVSVYSPPFVASESWQSTTAVATQNYTDIESSSSAPAPGMSYPIFYVNNNQQIRGQWVRTRISPPSGVSPSTVFGSVSTPVSGVRVSASNVVIDGNQYLNITAYESGGAEPYTYNFIVSNSVTNSILTFQQYTGVSTTSNSFLWHVPNLDAGNTLAVNVIVTDSDLSASNSITLAPLAVDTQFQNIGWTVSNSFINEGQTETLTATVSGGTNSITYSQFNGMYPNNAVINFGNKALFDAFPITIVAWIRTTSSLSAGIVNKYVSSTYNGYQLFLTSGQITAWYYNSYEDDVSQFFGGNVDDGKWHQVMFIVNSVGGQLYVDGNLKNSQGWSGSPEVTTTSQNLQFGIYPNGAGGATSQYLNGSIADVQIYNTSLSSTQVTALYSEGITGAPLWYTGNVVGWWPLNGNANYNGANVIDYSGHQNNGVPANVAYSTTNNAITYNFTVYASNGMLVTNSLSSSGTGLAGIPSTSNAFAFSTAGWAGGVYTANIIVSDSATTYATATNSITFTVNSIPAPTISVSNVILDGTQYLNLTAYTNGGAEPYTYNFIISNSVTNSIINSQQYTSIPTNSYSFVWQVSNADAGQTLGVNVIVTDNNIYTSNSIETFPLMINPQFTNIGWTGQDIGIGQTETLTSTVAGGTNSIPYSQFSSDSDYITINKEFFQDSSFTILAWVYWPQSTNLAGGCGSNGDCGYAWSGPAASDQGFGIFSRNDQWYLNFFGDDLECSSGPSTGEWYQFGASWNSNTDQRTIWVNGASACSGSSGGQLDTSSPFIIGSAHGTWDGTATMDGAVTNLQLYNASLAASQVNSLYAEGITGAPLSFNSLVGWWLLNGANVTDYSRNQNYGAPTSVSYSASYNAFTYNDLVYASNGMLVTNSLVVSTSATSNAFVFNTIGWLSGTYTANTIVEDSATTYSTVTNSITFTVGQLTTTTVPPCGGGICGSGGTGVSSQSTTIPNTVSSTTQLTTFSSTSTTTVSTTTIPAPPIEVSVTPTGQTTSPLCNGTTEGFSVDYRQLGAIFDIASATDSCFTVTAINATSVANVINNDGHALIKAINFTASTTDISANATLSYPCNEPSYSVAPYILRNGAWHEITLFSVNAGECTVTFNVPPDPTIALFYNQSAVPSIAATSQTTAQQTQQNQSSNNLILLILIIIVVVVIALFAYGRRKHK